MIAELNQFLKIPSISANPAYAQDVQECALFLKAHFQKIGFTDVEVHQTAGHPIVLAKYIKDPAKPTVLIYGHYDVQPPDPLNEWLSPPFEPTIRDGYIYARGASDDKGQVFCHIKAAESLPCNMIFLIEGEEEVGSPNLTPFLKTHKESLKADIVLISDTPMFSADQPSICTSLRGLCYAQITLTGGKTDLHSGQHGGVAPNALNELCHIIDQLKDRSGRILIPGFYDAILPTTPPPQGNIYQKLWYEPTLDCNGIWGGYQGPGAKTVIPAQAGAKISMRLVPNQDPDDIFKKLDTYLNTLTKSPFQITAENLHGAKPVRVNTDHSAFNAAKTAMKKAWGIEPIFTGEGGSIPIVLSFREILGLESILMGFNLSDDNIHGPNERFKLDSFCKGIEASLAFLNYFKD